MEAARQQCRVHLAILDRQLAGKTFAVGDRFSAVEICYAPFLDFLGTVGLEAPANVAAWHARMQERPSVATTRLER